MKSHRYTKVSETHDIAILLLPGFSMSVLENLLQEISTAGVRLQLFSLEGVTVRSSKGIPVQALPLAVAPRTVGSLVVCGDRNADIERVKQRLRTLPQGRELAGAITDTRQLRGSEEGKPAGDRVLLREALDLMQNNLVEPLTTGEIATYLGATPKKLERVFRRYGYRLPSRHYLSLRLEYARTLLRNSRFSIDEVGRRCGFGSASHFSRSYRAFAGHTPRDERKQWGDNRLPRGSAAAFTGKLELETRI